MSLIFFFALTKICNGELSDVCLVVLASTMLEGMDLLWGPSPDIKEIVRFI
jgi:hypothetical protein